MLKGGDDAGRMEGFVPAGPGFGIESNKCAAGITGQDKRVGWSAWSFLGTWSFLEFFLLGFEGFCRSKGLLRNAVQAKMAGRLA